MINRSGQSRYRMPIRERFRRLNLWNKINAIGALASIAGIFLALLLAGVPPISRSDSREEQSLGPNRRHLSESPIDSEVQPITDEYKDPEEGTPLPGGRITPEVGSTEREFRSDSLPLRSWDDPIDLGMGPELAFWMDEELPNHVHLPESEQAKRERFGRYALKMMRCATAFDHVARMRQAGWNAPIILEKASCSLLSQSSDDPVTEQDVKELKAESYHWVVERHRQLDRLFYHYVGECMGWLRRTEQLLEHAGYSDPQAVREEGGSLEPVFRNFIAPSGSAAEVFSPEQTFFIEQVFRGISNSASMWGTGNIHTWCILEGQKTPARQ